jgi:hypothetical protein
MTAPAAPTIQARTDGSKVYLRWKAVAGAATYNVYASDVTAPTAQVQSGLTATDWGQAVVLPLDAAPFLRMTAVNAGAEESAYSNEVHFTMNGPGASFPPTAPSDKGVRRGPFGGPG